MKLTTDSLSPNERLFWRRVANLKWAIANAGDIVFKALWKDKLRTLMKKVDKI